MKTKLEDLENRHFSTPTKKVLPRLKPQLLGDCNSQYLSSDLKTGGMMQVLVWLMMLNMHLSMLNLFVGVETAVQGDVLQIQEYGAGC